MLLFLLAVGIRFLVKRRKVQHYHIPVLTTPEKAQVHSDSFVKPAYKLAGEGDFPIIAELPAKEPVGSELDASKDVRRSVE
ncbi:hypothetical protein WAI453_000915 [Rhynchosporium graminicola]